MVFTLFLDETVKFSLKNDHINKIKFRISPSSVFENDKEKRISRVRKRILTSR